MEGSLRISSLLCILCLIGLTDGQEPNADKCKGVICPRGRMCVSKESDAGSFTICECPSSCPGSDNQAVCTYYNSQFINRCEMHKYACAHDLTMKVKNEGICEPDGNTYPCPESVLLQFPSRYLEWIMLAREKSFDPTFNLDPGAKADSLTEEERRQVLSWEFDFIDKNKNDLLDTDELKKIFDDLLSMEPCIYGFLMSCDLNGKNGIERREWEACFPLTGTALQSRR